MYETHHDLEELQRLLDESYAGAGTHLRSITTPERRLDAAGVVSHTKGVRVLHLATVTARAEPRVSPVDSLFYRGHFYFGSSPESMKFRHIRQRPQVSGTVTAGEELAITVHGVAVQIDTAAPDQRGLRDYIVETYGAAWWDEWGAGAPYARIDPTKMFTYFVPPRNNA
ncbi:pyridoxamine 5'-phosphate oxidase family protein [Actinocrispum wychmicini]|uniref:Pyridoxamine 5'-phosphate oxidase n=1 Tax=Actinocrispum wychmicini TaxID=1213861 RepID=A0A4V2S6Q7_9PSEU|nr:pyridoxamine 5'-phosphate oxidase family protein [Actinocrispum wychmicini]TCO56990.1 pyridoxamine 5'-phosphate oxidase [Actinocrispum wychmicini]